MQGVHPSTPGAELAPGTLGERVRPPTTGARPAAFPSWEHHMDSILMDYDPDTDVVRVRTDVPVRDCLAVPLEDLTILVSHELDQIVGVNIDDLPSFGAGGARSLAARPRRCAALSRSGEALVVR